MSDEIVAMVLRTFGKVYPYLEVWDVAEGDIVLLGSRKPWTASTETFRKTWERETPRKDLEAIGLRSPEAIWARQLASQKTAFAIAGDGAIQSDGFPVLEYEAPKAFYLGTGSKLLALFDERTWQTQLAPDAKNTALAGLTDDVLKAAFRQYLSADANLTQYLIWRYNGKSDPTASDVFFDGRPMPCVFRPTNAAAGFSPIPKGASDELKRLRKAEDSLYSLVSQWRESVEVIEKILSDLQSGLNNRPIDWSPSYFAMLAARISLRHGDLDGAQHLVSLGRRLEPQSQELLYLGRILARQSAPHASSRPP
jgi:hypothetical protein